jgi:hypothetical protein
MTMSFFGELRRRNVFKVGATNDPVLEQPEFVAVRAELTGD